jgi:hypothetical protein
VTVQISFITCKGSLIASDHHRAGVVKVELAEKTVSIVHLLLFSSLKVLTLRPVNTLVMQPHRAALLFTVFAKSHHQLSTIPYFL